MWILHSHGNAEDIGATTGWLTVLAELLPANILVYDYEGYGKSQPGLATEV